MFYLPPFPFSIGFPPLFFACQFLTDWVTGIFLAVALWILPSDTSFDIRASWIGKFRQVADLTFPIYVLHNPLLILWRGTFEHHFNGAANLAVALVTVLLITAAIGIGLEKQRIVWVKFFKWLLNRVYYAVNTTTIYPKQSPS